MSDKIKQALQERLIFSGVSATARRVKCSREHLSRVLHGKRVANEELRRRLWRLGIVKNAIGGKI